MEHVGEKHAEPDNAHAPDRASDSMGSAWLQAGVSIASGIAGLVLTDPVGGAIGMAIGGGGAAAYPFIKHWRANHNKPPSKT